MSSVAKSYAKTLLEAAQDFKLTGQDVDVIENQLEELSKMVAGSPDLRVVFAGPAASTQEKVSLVREFAKRMNLGSLLSNFLVLLARKERLGFVSEVAEAFGVVRLEAAGGVAGQVVSADPIESSDLDSLGKVFSAKLGKKIAFKTSIDPDLLAGMKVTISGVTYDGTLRTQLQRLRDRIASNASVAH